MFVRSTIEKYLPVRDDERKLTDEARKIAFKGGYIWPRTYSGIKQDRNFDRTTKSAYPHVPEITRTYNDGVEDFSKGNVYSYDASALMTEINSAEGLNRVNRVEKVSRKIKAGLLTAVPILTIGSAVLFIPEGPDGNESDTSCDVVADETSLLIPVDSPMTITTRDGAPDLAAKLCEMNGTQFEVFNIEG